MQSGDCRRVTANVLEIEREGQHAPEERPGIEQRCGGRRGKGAVRKQPQGQDGAGAPSLEEDKRAQARHGGHDRKDDDRRAPPAQRPLDERPGQERQRAGCCQLSRQVEASARRSLGRSHEAERHRYRDEPDRHVEQEDAAPTERRDEQSAEQRPRCAGDRGERAPNADGSRSLSLIGVRLSEDGQRRRHEERGTHTLQDSGKHQRAEVRRRATQGGREGEGRESGQEHAPRAKAIPETASDQQQARKRERVAVDDPGEPA